MAKRRNGEGTYGVKEIKGVKYHYYRDVNGKYTYGKTVSIIKEKIKTRKSEEKFVPKNNTIKESTTFGEYILAWLTTIRKKDLGKNLEFTTYDSYEDAINGRIINYTDYDLNGRSLQSLTTDCFQDYLDSLAKKYAKGTIDKTWQLIKQCVKYGEIKGDIKPNLLSLVRKPTESNVAVKRKEIGIASIEDMDLLYKEGLRKFSNGRYIYGNASKVVILIMYTGMRVSEANGLKWKSIDLKNKNIKVENALVRIKNRDENTDTKYKLNYKNTKSLAGYRDIPMSDIAEEMIKYFDTYNKNHTDNDYVCLNENMSPFTKDNVNKCIKRMCKNANCNSYSIHALRHSFGSVLLSKGVEIKIISELLGHSRIQTTYDIYLRVSKQDKIKSINLLNKKENNENEEN